ncbi:hypothetical protein Pelo_13033 [Pelomyxa schiedti]|nr:hypothetical protein Pelo_13033 [Pelomyxa schiedti]
MVHTLKSNWPQFGRWEPCIGAHSPVVLLRYNIELAPFQQLCKEYILQEYSVPKESAKPFMHWIFSFELCLASALFSSDMKLTFATGNFRLLYYNTFMTFPKLKIPDIANNVL